MIPVIFKRVHHRRLCTYLPKKGKMKLLVRNLKQKTRPQPAGGINQSPERDHSAGKDGRKKGRSSAVN